jgi:hypothetical protein
MKADVLSLICRVREIQSGVKAMARKRRFGISLERVPRFVSFDAGVVAALLGIGIYLAIVNRHWIAAAFFLLGVFWIVSIPIRLRVRKSNARQTRS